MAELKNQRPALLLAFGSPSSFSNVLELDLLLIQSLTAEQLEEFVVMEAEATHSEPPVKRSRDGPKAGQPLPYGNDLSDLLAAAEVARAQSNRLLLRSATRYRARRWNAMTKIGPSILILSSLPVESPCD